MAIQVQRGRASGGGPGRFRQQREHADLVRAALGGCSLFAALPAERFEAVVAASGAATFARRERLSPQTGEPERVHVVASGRVRVARPVGRDKSLTVAYREPGELLGETALAASSRYRTIAVAVEPVEAVQIPLGTMKELLLESAQFSRSMLELMVARRIDAERRVQSLLSGSVESRVAELLLDAAERNGVPDARGVLVGARYTHQEIADYVGSTRETVTLTLGEMRRKQLLTFDHRRIVLLRPETLRSQLDEG
ncbi:MAG: Crp/Fnr family transcriptional regulator [Polyangiales bacterium]